MKQNELSQRRKEQMAASLKKLMTKKSIQKISIQELADDCGMNRYTFYYHFQDIYDLLKWTFSRDFEMLFSDQKHCANWEEWLRIILQYLKDNAAFCKAAINSVGRDTLRDLCVNDLQYFMERMLKDIKGERSVPEDYLNFLASFYLEALCGILIQWILSDMNIPMESLIRYLHITLEKTLDSALTKAETELN